MKSELVSGEPFHAGQIARTLRLEHRELLLAMGVNLHRDLRQTFDASAYRRSWFVDGKLMAIGGVTGPISASEGMIWLAVNEAAMAHRLRLARLVLKLLEELSVTKRRLLTTVLLKDEAAIRFAYFLGFRSSERTSINGADVLIMIYDRSLQKVA